MFTAPSNVSTVASTFNVATFVWAAFISHLGYCKSINCLHPYSLDTILFQNCIEVIVDLQCCINFCCRAQCFSYPCIFFSILVYHRMLNIVPCAIQQDLVVYSFSVKYLASADPKLPIHPSPAPLPLGNHRSVFRVWVCFSFVDKFICAVF